MDDVWQHIEAVFQQRYPLLLDLWNTGASEEQINRLQELIGVELPDDVLASYRITNGALREAWIMPRGEFLSLERIEEEWSMWAELVSCGQFLDIESEPKLGIRPDWYNVKWIPITCDWFGNPLCIDLDPAPGGRVGQIITMWHDSGDRETIAMSFRQWLENYASKLESQSIIYVENHVNRCVIVERD